MEGDKQGAEPKRVKLRCEHAKCEKEVTAEGSELFGLCPEHWRKAKKILANPSGLAH